MSSSSPKNSTTNPIDGRNTWQSSIIAAHQTTISDSTPASRRLVPAYFHQIDPIMLEEMISEMLMRIANHNDQIPVTESSLTRFHSRAPPSISIGDYLRRIMQFAALEKAVLLMILAYIDRICERNPQFTISSLTIHRFLIAAAAVGSKALCDSYCTNSHYARVGGVSTQELNTLEVEFLFMIRWELFCDKNVLQNYYEHLIDHNVAFTRLKDSSIAPEMLDSFDKTVYVT